MLPNFQLIVSDHTLRTKFTFTNYWRHTANKLCVCVLYNKQSPKSFKFGALNLSAIATDTITQKIHPLLFHWVSTMWKMAHNGEITLNETFVIC